MQKTIKRERKWKRPKTSVLTCPRCEHRKCPKCTVAPRMKGERFKWNQEKYPIPLKLIADRMVCCKCERSTFAVDWYAGFPTNGWKTKQFSERAAVRSLLFPNEFKRELISHLRDDSGEDFLQWLSHFQFGKSGAKFKTRE